MGGAGEALPDIGPAGGAGFGVGVAPASDLAALGLAPLPGHNVVGHENYGNYQHELGSIVVYIPRFWLRIGHADSPRYAVYGVNAVDILPAAAFATQAAALAAGYFMPRAFIDGGVVKKGFFRDKFLASQDGSGSAAVSVRNGVPISLTTTSTYTRSAGMPGCVGQLHDAVTLSRARGAGWNCQSIFIASVVALLSLAHGQAAASATHCAWYDPARTTNFPKGCNNNALRDANDASVLFTSAGDTGAAAKGRTGSGVPFAKTTHNGQPCGIADDNGLMWECLLGLTAPGASPTDSVQRSDGRAWLLHQEVALGDLTAGWGGATGAWQPAATIGALYEEIADFLPWGAATAWQYFGNAASQVFSGAPSAVDQLRTSCGVASASGLGAGTNLFGSDGCYRYNRANLFPLAGASWGDAFSAGVFARYWDLYRASVYNGSVGFRAAAYGS
jgi:hypothetical protein